MIQAILCFNIHDRDHIFPLLIYEVTSVSMYLCTQFQSLLDISNELNPHHEGYRKYPLNCSECNEFYIFQTGFHFELRILDIYNSLPLSIRMKS
ncbi:hypothetical protein RchiOBHm_Chr1g0363401 [Rosa chinensis]|uniref:Uncharacterized protein n=1 Tax=Rosa chinensis TaxID=74649 RepID=A0A2P6SJF6_ROSCH|nr:hypothetical protein RchiOBHm_Chr1g0363401 [Rosa chinensis]